MIAWQSASNRRTSSVMLSSTRKIARAPCAARVGDVGEHALDRVRVKVPAAHLDDRAEAAVVGAAARGFDDVDLAAEQRVAAEHARAAIGQLRASSDFERRDRTIRVVHEPLAAPVRQPGDRVRRRPPDLERPQQFPERELAFAAHQELDRRARFVGFGREARIVAAGDDSRRPAAGGEPARATFIAVARWNVMTDSPTTSGWSSCTRRAIVGPTWPWTRIRSAIDDAVMAIDVAGERRERAVGNPDRHRRHVLERVRHRQQEDVHTVACQQSPVGSCRAGPFRPARSVSVEQLTGRQTYYLSEEMLLSFERRLTRFRCSPNGPAQPSGTRPRRAIGVPCGTRA